MRSVFINKSLSGISYEQFRDDQKPNIFFTVECLLKDMASVTVSSKFNDVSSEKNVVFRTVPKTEVHVTHLIHAAIFLRSSTDDAASKHRCTAQFPKLSDIEDCKFPNQDMS